MTERHTFCKAEHLCSHKVIEALFGGGNKSFSAYPIRAVFMPMKEVQKEPVQLMITVSKRHFKHAVDRNRVKRQIREAYRLNKQILLSALPEDKGMAIAFIWLSDEHFDTKVVEEKVKKLLAKLAENTGTEPQ